MFASRWPLVLLAAALLSACCAMGTPARGSSPPCAMLPRAAPAFALGHSFMGLAETDVSLQCERGGPVEVPTRYSSHIYGTCTSTRDAGCAVPIEIQNWPECARNYSDYEQRVGDSVLSSARSRALTGQLVPAAQISPTQIELYAGPTTVVVFANTAARARSASRGVAIRITHRLPHWTFAARRRAALRPVDCNR